MNYNLTIIYLAYPQLHTNSNPRFPVSLFLNFYLRKLAIYGRLASYSGTLFEAVLNKPCHFLVLFRDNPYLCRQNS